SAASSLCGACTETCPVKIDLHHHLLQNRRNGAKARPGLLEKIGYKIFAFGVNRPGVYALGKRMARWLQPLQRMVKGTLVDPMHGWTKTRDLPPVAPQSFKDWWRERK